MVNFQSMFNEIQIQEEELRFSRFSRADALEIGLLLYRASERNGTPVAVEIKISGQTVFKYSPEGTTPNNDLWLTRKSNMVNIRQMSSLRAFALLNLREQDIEKDWHLSPKQYAACGGGFPIYIHQVGVIGTICVSGLPHLSDHQLIIDVLKKHLLETS